jgi:predicted dehydrogenase
MMPGAAETETLGSESDLKPARLGFAGMGWIGKPRMRAILASGAGNAVAMYDPRPEMCAEASVFAPEAEIMTSYDELLQCGLDGIVIATPNALHAEQAVRALEAGLAVFCQKPLGINARETRRVIEAARSVNRLLGVDLSYRHTEAMRVLRSTVQAGELGDIYAVDVMYHSAYGPDNAWSRDFRMSGGGCVIDLGIHMLDLALWTLGFPRVTDVTSRLFSEGERITGSTDGIVEDYATALLDLDTAVSVNFGCSWNLPAGTDAQIHATFYGTEGGASFHNVKGSFYDFTAELFRGTHRHVLAAPPDDWGGRAAVTWTRALARGATYDPWVEGVADVAAGLDRILRR